MYCLLTKNLILSWHLNGLDPDLIRILDSIFSFFYSVYRSDLYLPLVLTILRLGHERTITYLGMTKQFTTPAFFDCLIANDLQYRMIPHEVVKNCNFATSFEGNIGLFVVFKSSWS